MDNDLSSVPPRARLAIYDEISHFLNNLLNRSINTNPLETQLLNTFASTCEDLQANPPHRRHQKWLNRQLRWTDATLKNNADTDIFLKMSVYLVAKDMASLCLPSVRAILGDIPQSEKEDSIGEIIKVGDALMAVHRDASARARAMGWSGSHAYVHGEGAPEGYDGVDCYAADCGWSDKDSEDGNEEKPESADDEDSDGSVHHDTCDDTVDQSEAEVQHNQEDDDPAQAAEEAEEDLIEL